MLFDLRCRTANSKMARANMIQAQVEFFVICNDEENAAYQVKGQYVKEFLGFSYFSSLEENTLQVVFVYPIDLAITEKICTSYYQKCYEYQQLMKSALDLTFCR